MKKSHSGYFKKRPVLPKMLQLSWETDPKKFPTRSGCLSLLLCYDKQDKNYWFTCGEFIYETLKKTDYSRWHIVGPVFGDSFVADGKGMNWFDVMAWAEVKMAS